MDALTPVPGRDRGATVSVIEDVRRFLGADLRIGGMDTVAADAALIDRGILDSIEVIQLAEHLEQRYGIEVQELDLERANLGSLAAIARFVERKLGRAS
jgi:acyl carrier protein